MTFAMVFADQQPSVKVSSHENLDQSGNESVSQKCKNGSDSLGQLEIQLSTAPEAIDYINTTKIQRKRQIDKSKIKTLHPQK